MDQKEVYKHGKNKLIQKESVIPLLMIAILVGDTVPVIRNKTVADPKCCGKNLTKNCQKIPTLALINLPVDPLTQELLPVTENYTVFMLP